MINKLIEKIGNTNTPEFIPLLVESYAKENMCFFNVLEKVSIDQGCAVYGWKLFEGDFIYDAVRHAVWKSPTGQLVDITPDPKCIDVVCFLEEDKGWVYSGNYVDNIRVIKTENPLVEDFILIAETITKLKQANLDYQKTGIVNPIIESEIETAIVSFNHCLRNTELFLRQSNNIESDCYCSNGKKYSVCHRVLITDWCNNVIPNVYRLICGEL